LRHRRPLLVHRGLPAGASRQPGRHLPRGEGAARDRRRVRDPDLLLRPVSRDGPGGADARARLHGATGAARLGACRPRPRHRSLDLGAGAEVGPALQLLPPARLPAAAARPGPPPPARGGADAAGRAVSHLRGDRRPVLAVTAMPGNQLRSAILDTRSIRACVPGLRVVWGGYFPTLHADVVLRSDLVDAVVRGQGEETFVE